MQKGQQSKSFSKFDWIAFINIIAGARRRQNQIQTINFPHSYAQNIANDQARIAFRLFETGLTCSQGRARELRTLEAGGRGFFPESLATLSKKKKYPKERWLENAHELFNKDIWEAPTMSFWLNKVIVVSLLVCIMFIGERWDCVEWGSICWHHSWAHTKLNIGTVIGWKTDERWF